VQTTVTKITQRIKEVEILLEAYTEQEIPLADVNIANLEIEVPTTTSKYSIFMNFFRNMSC
jgi:hypothetical protein